MNKLNVYSLFDEKSLTFEGLYLFQNHQSAVRGFRHSVGQIPFPEDKKIVFIGVFDSLVGDFDFSPENVLTVGYLLPEVENDK